MNEYYVYIATNNSMTLYIGVTNDLSRRIDEHILKSNPGFTSHYNIDKLVYFERTNSIDEALLREKQLKNWNRAKKLVLIESINPKWLDLQIDSSTSLGMTNVELQ